MCVCDHHLPVAGVSFRPCVLDDVGGCFYLFCFLVLKPPPSPPPPQHNKTGPLIVFMVICYHQSPMRYRNNPDWVGNSARCVVSAGEMRTKQLEVRVLEGGLQGPQVDLAALLVSEHLACFRDG